jgi:hypothetical protein
MAMKWKNPKVLAAIVFAFLLSTVAAYALVNSYLRSVPERPPWNTRVEEDEYWKSVKPSWDQRFPKGMNIAKVEALLLAEGYRGYKGEVRDDSKEVKRRIVFRKPLSSGDSEIVTTQFIVFYDEQNNITDTELGSTHLTIER